MSQDISLLADLRLERQAWTQNFLQTNADSLLLENNGENDLLRVLTASDYFLEQLRHQPELFFELACSGDLNTRYHESSYDIKLTKLSDRINGREQLEQLLRRFRNREMLRLIWRDVLGLADVEEIMADTSALAQACIRATVSYLQQELEARFGRPSNAQGEHQLLQVVAMGKLGGEELNLSSDIDLIFCYPDAGYTDLAENSISNQLFFTKLAQQISLVLNKVTRDGFVFRVDMRLRPYGESGPLVINYVALRDYFAKSARQWERYAFVKARVICGETESNQRLLQLCRQFVYQDAADKKITRILKEIKIKICQQVARQSIESNIKLGEGGIREIEFIVQAFQLIYGPENPNLCNTNLLSVLLLLKDNSFLAPEVAEKLQQAYLFLRLLENRLQAMNDSQEHRLPCNELIQARLANTLGYQNWHALLIRLTEFQAFVSKQFAKVINQPLEEISVSRAESIKNMRYQQQVAVEKLLTDWRQQSHIAEKQYDSLWHQFSTSLTQESLKHTKPCEVAERTIQLLATLIEKRPEVLTILEAHSERLVQVSGSSQWLAAELTRYPELVVELIVLDQIELPRNLVSVQILLEKRLIDFEMEQGAEAFLTVLNRFKYEYTMRIAIADVLDQVKVMRVSDLLTDLAIAILRRVLQWGWQELVKECGYPKQVNGQLCDLDFIIVAYGKLGGIELGYASDLDLVFLHDADENALTNGTNPITGAQFYQRLGKRLIELLNTQTTQGRLYKVDTQLKPMGKAGLLVNSFSSYANYQRQNAWTWEHQALVRARVIAGDSRLSECFANLREEILIQARHIAELAQDVVTMRERMQAEKKPSSETFHLKEGRGGITEIEFIAQFVVLAWAQRQPLLLMFPDNIRIFETCESAGLLSRRTVDLLCNAYRTFRKVSHRLTLQGKQGVVSVNQFKKLRQEIIRVWQFLLSDVQNK